MSKFQRGDRQDARGFQGRGDRQNPHGSRSPNNGPFNRNGPNINRLNPWEGGVAPGAGNNIMNMGHMGNIGSMGNMGNMGNPNMGNPNMGSPNMPSNRHSGGLLPTPNMSGPGLLPQPSMQDVQLSIASNVLNLLLPTMQQNQQQNQMPSVLGLGSNRPGLLGPPVFPNQNFGGPGMQGAQGAPGSKDNGGLVNRPRPFMAGRRPEPFNKMGNRNQRPGQKGDERKGVNASQRSAGPRTGTSPKNNTQQARNIKNEKGDGRTNQRSEGGPNNKNKDGKVKQDSDKDGEMEKAKAAYADIPSELFNCHVCSKNNMWDSSSFINHIKGKAHQSMMERREESYKLKTEVMRHQMKVDEEQRQMDAERLQRQGKSMGPPQPREYCTMCNLNFNGNLSAHRKSEKHQALKSFLHPKCDICYKEFGTRIDWDQHLLTAGHLKAVSTQDGFKSVGDGSPNKCNRQSGDGNLNKRPRQSVEGISSESVNAKTENVKAGSDAVLKTNSPDTANKIGVKKGDTVQINSLHLNPENVPEYDSQKVFGTEMLQEKTGYLCRCCNRFLSCSADAQTHCRSQYHYDKYISFLNSKQTKSPKRSEMEPATPPKEDMSKNDTSEDKEKGRVQDDEKQDELQEDKVKDEVEQEEEEEDEEDEGNWKRRKIAKDDDEEIAKTDHMNNEDQQTVEDKNVQDTAIEKEGSDVAQANADTPDDTAASSDAAGKEEDIPEDLEKTLLIEETPTPTAQRGRGRGRGGTPRAMGRGSPRKRPFSKITPSKDSS